MSSTTHAYIARQGQQTPKGIPHEEVMAIMHTFINNMQSLHYPEISLNHHIWCVRCHI
jgi:hypothetical protein